MNNEKTYIGFFYGVKREIKTALNQITDGNFVRYIMTAETLICRFSSKKRIGVILKILQNNCPDTAFFVFPINKNNWCYNLRDDVENNLLTDNPIIINKEHNIINSFFMSIINELAKKKNNQDGSCAASNIDSVLNDLDTQLNRAVAEENYELAAQIKNKIKEIKEN